MALVKVNTVKSHYYTRINTFLISSNTDHYNIVTSMDLALHIKQEDQKYLVLQRY